MRPTKGTLFGALNSLAENFARGPEGVNHGSRSTTNQPPKTPTSPTAPGRKGGLLVQLKRNP